MIGAFRDMDHRAVFPRSLRWPCIRSALVLVLAACLATGCTRYAAPDRPRDMAAERVAAGLMNTNAGLTRFKCVGKMTLSGPTLASQSFRAGIAGRLKDELRVDLLAPFGGSAASFAGNGTHLFFIMHASRDYYKKPFNNGSLYRFIQIDLAVGDLLEILVGRIPMDEKFSASLLPGADGSPVQLALMDRRGQTRQLITFDESRHPDRSVWFDKRQLPVRTLSIQKRQTVDGFSLPQRIDLTAVSGDRIVVTLDHCEANPDLEDRLFVLEPPSS